MPQIPDDPNRNPLVIPRLKPEDLPKRGCPACGSDRADSFMSYGVVTHKCLKCGNKWHGGVGMVAQDPREPMPPLNPKDAPLVDFEKTKDSVSPQEVRPRRADPTQNFRKGLPVPGDDGNG